MNIVVSTPRDHPVRQIFRSMPAPREVICDLVHYPARLDKPEYWIIRLYAQSFYRLRSEDRVVVEKWISDLIRTIREVEPNCFLEVEDS